VFTKGDSAGEHSTVLACRSSTCRHMGHVWSNAVWEGSSIMAGDRGPPEGLRASLPPPPTLVLRLTGRRTCWTLGTPCPAATPSNALVRVDGRVPTAMRRLTVMRPFGNAT
jgi:hypothetical protein